MNDKLRLTILEPAGILDKITGNQLQNEISNLINHGTNVILIDMQGIKFIDSSGLGYLVSAMKIVSNANAKFFVCSVSDQVKMLFEITKVNKSLQIFADKDDCKRYVLNTLSRMSYR
ncbi:STAS domain-containing protein [Nostoc sp. FACHB-87]|uniref:STAS domain-containing protein n=1 Tax=Nostocales TaxID=1161 RepID=UPI001681CF09|nr:MULTISPECIES: STAS domain-containing protein [Nostocales]MBD2299005.1 STAS domain-containing protein [Nostoc sp. FACHB-190]MBD2453171.1 STAS domain-containing protein [Nostoc sp. FACHB-87]MBD2475050.1 STAS domain-containing protein [Anabaena sp. FACHB-83]MBD2489333.1 STAS domain-containing protein [Aulosira sp. FACHB-615]